MSSQKSSILYIKRYLETQTDENHPVRLPDILTYLDNIGIPASRKTVAQDIDSLIESGIDIVCNVGHHYEYFVGVRHFELPWSCQNKKGYRQLPCCPCLFWCAQHGR